MTTLAEAPVEQDRKFLYADALPIAQKFIAFLERHCSRCVVAGSLRRRKQLVSDIEILFVSKRTYVTDPADLFGAQFEASAAELAIDALVTAGVIAKRLNKNGHPTWGPQNKLAVHIGSGIPVDFFATTEECFFNALVVRTGPAALNKEIASRALERGWEWHAYGNGFTRGRETKRVKSEHDVFAHVQLEYKEPANR
jgi:DNA polymerase/3'-5' exonuclease PolX